MHMAGGHGRDARAGALQSLEQGLGAKSRQCFTALEVQQMEGRGGHGRTFWQRGKLAPGVDAARRSRAAGRGTAVSRKRQSCGATRRILKARWDNPWMAITIKSAADIEGMRLAGRLASEVLDMLTPHVNAGVTTKEIDRLAHQHMVQVQQGIPATLGYQPAGYPAYPASLCTSLNDVVCHGIPDDRPLKDGDVINIDVTVIKDGWHGDNSRMFIVGEGTIATRRLCQVTFDAMWKGIVKVRPGARLGDIGHAIQTFAENAGFSVVREFCGHGVGARFHEEPQVLHYGRPGTLETLLPGMIFTIEPMINAGRRDIKEDRKGNRPYDGWTIVTRDRSLSAQWEHSVLVTETGYEVLTVSAGSPLPPDFASAGYGGNQNSQRAAAGADKALVVSTS